MFGYDPGGSRYSPLTQITPANVTKLKEAEVALERARDSALETARVNFPTVRAII